MGEFAIAGDGHAWNNSLAHATFEDNVSTHGQETALKFLRADIRSWISERKNESHQWSLYVRDGHMMTETGVSLDEMTSNITNGPHSDLVPENIKVTAYLEAATLSEATRLVVTGAGRIVLPEQHLDAQGNVVSRYLSVWTKNSSDPTRYDGSRIDLGKNIRIEDVRTGISFTAFEQHEGISFHQHQDQKHAFVLAVHSHEKVPIEAMKDVIMTKVHRSHQETYIQNVQPARFEEKQAQGKALDQRESVRVSTVQKDRHTDLLMVVPRAVVRESHETVLGIAVFLRDKHKRREDDFHVRPREKKTERVTLEKIRERPMRMMEAIEKRHSEMKKGMAVLEVIAETGIVAYAAPAMLARLAEKLPTPILAIKKSTERHAKKELRRKNSLEKTRDKKELRKAKQDTKKDSVKGKPLRLERVEPLRATKEQKRRKKPGWENGTPPRRAIAEKLTPIASEKRGRREKRKMRRAVEKRELRIKKKELRTSAKREIQKDSVKVQTLTERRRSIQRKKREAVAGMVFGWMVWVMVNRANFPPVGSKLATFSGEQKRLDPILRGDDKEVSTPWVLLSIIWYLTMLREQGTQNTTNTTNTTRFAKARARRANNSMKKRKIMLPQYAVIFAYNS